MAFHETRFPEDISYGSRGGPGFNTDVIILGSGFEQRNINWANSRSDYDVAYGVKTGDQLDSLIAFFRARFGKAHGFRYKDWADFECEQQPATQIDSTHYQISKVYSSGGYSYTRELKKIVDGSVTVYVGGVPQGSGWTLDYNTGIITFGGAPGGAVTVTCEFDVPVRFDTDKLSTSLDNYNAEGTYFGGASVPLIEIRI